MTACGSLAREVPRRNFRSLSVVSGEKVYRRASDACEGYISEPGPEHGQGGRGDRTMTHGSRVGGAVVIRCEAAAPGEGDRAEGKGSVGLQLGRPVCSQ